MSVYALKKSLRLPKCGKITKSNFEQRHLLPITNSTTADFIVSNTNNVVYTIPFNILLDESIAVDLPLFTVNLSQLDVQHFKEFLASNEETKKVEWKLKQNKESFISARPSNSYNCPVCKSRHDSRGLYAVRKGKNMVVNCFKNNELKNVFEPISVNVVGEDKQEQFQKI